MAQGRINEYVYFSPELYQLKSEVAPRLYRVQGCTSRHRNVIPKDALGPAKIKSGADVSPTQLIGL